MDKIPQKLMMEPTKITLFKSLCIASILCIFETYFFYNISTKDAMKGLENNVRSAAFYIKQSSNFTEKQQKYIEEIAENYQKLKEREIKRKNKENRTYFINAIFIITLLIVSTIGTGVLSQNIINNYKNEILVLVFLTIISISIFQYFFYKTIASKYQYQSQEELLFALKKYIVQQEERLTK